MERARSCADDVAWDHLDEGTKTAWLRSMHGDSRFEHASGECEGIVVLLSNEKQVKFSSPRNHQRESDMTGMPPRKIRLSVSGITLEAEIKSNKTADEIYAALPIEAPVNTWGEEFYFKFAGMKDFREMATTQVKIGDIAVWGVGQVVAIFFGRTPMSMGPEPVPADRVNVIGRILGDATQLRHVMDATRIRIEKV
jgi:hypothetical protein